MVRLLNSFRFRFACSGIVIFVDARLIRAVDPFVTRLGHYPPINGTLKNISKAALNAHIRAIFARLDY